MSFVYVLTQFRYLNTLDSDAGAASIVIGGNVG
jgi:hypothetical protein